MSITIAGTKVAVVLLAALALTGCAAPSAQSRATLAQQQACRRQADQAYQVRNPGASYAAYAYVSGMRDTPFSSTGATGDTTSGLAGRYSRDSMYSDCVNGIGPPLGAGSTTTTTTTTSPTTSMPTTTAPPPPPP
jgi:hypothetical protein